MSRLSGRWYPLPWILLALSIYAAALFSPPLPGMSVAGQAVLGVALAGVLLWASEAVPLGYAASFVLVLLGTVPGGFRSTNFQGFASPVVFFLIGAVAIGTAVERSGLAKRLANLLVRSADGSPTRLYVQMLASLPGLAFLMPSAITRNAVLVPACRDTLTAMGIRHSNRTGRALMLALGVLNPLASSAILTGGVTSMTASAMIGHISWLRWFVLMAVPYYALLLLGGVALRFFVGRFEAPDPRLGDPSPVSPLTQEELTTIAIIGLVSLLWLTDFLHGLSPAIPSLIGALLLCCPKFGVLGWRDFESRLSWGLILTVGASLSLADVMVRAGTMAWMGHQMILLFTGMTSSPLIIVVILIIATSLVHIAITNLAACVALLVPIAMTMARAAGLNPIVCALLVTIVIDSVIVYPVQTATNLIAYESGYFHAGDVRRFGFAMLALTIVVALCVAIPYWTLLGLPLVAD